MPPPRGRIGHQHGEASGKREVSGEGGALVAALFLDNLHQNNLPALDHLLDFVRAPPPPGALGQLFERILGADRFDVFAAAGILVAVAAFAVGLWLGARGLVIHFRDALVLDQAHGFGGVAQIGGRVFGRLFGGFFLFILALACVCRLALGRLFADSLAGKLGLFLRDLG